MKLKYEAPRGRRIKYKFMGYCQGKRTSSNNECWTYLPKEKKWIDTKSKEFVYKNQIMYTHAPCKTVRAFRRKLKTAPKGVLFVLCSRWVGYDVYGIGQGK